MKSKNLINILANTSESVESKWESLILEYFLNHWIVGKVVLLGLMTVVLVNR